jgi:hypothetical protein
MRNSASALIAIVVIIFAAPHAVADLAPRDPDDVDFHLDVQRVTSISTVDSIGLGVRFYEVISPRRQAKIKVWYDAFGSRAPDFALRFSYYRLGDHHSARCTFVRLSDHSRLDVSPPDDRADYVYCEFARPRRMQEHTGVRWRVEAIIQGTGRDGAPDAGWYPHT